MVRGGAEEPSRRSAVPEEEKPSRRSAVPEEEKPSWGSAVPRGGLAFGMLLDYYAYSTEAIY